MQTRSKGSTPDKLAVTTSKSVLGTNQNILNLTDETKQVAKEESTLGKRTI